MDHLKLNTILVVKLQTKVLVYIFLFRKYLPKHLVILLEPSEERIDYLEK